MWATRTTVPKEKNCCILLLESFVMVRSLALGLRHNVANCWCQLVNWHRLSEYSLVGSQRQSNLYFFGFLKLSFLNLGLVWFIIFGAVEGLCRTNVGPFWVYVGSMLGPCCSNFPFGLGFLLATFFFVFGTLFGRKKVALLNPFRAAKPTGKLPPCWVIWWAMWGSMEVPGTKNSTPIENFSVEVHFGGTWRPNPEHVDPVEGPPEGQPSQGLTLWRPPHRVNIK